MDVNQHGVVVGMVVVAVDMEVVGEVVVIDVVEAVVVLVTVVVADEVGVVGVKAVVVLVTVVVADVVVYFSSVGITFFYVYRPSLKCKGFTVMLKLN
ncbi:hypothetical protein DPMN_012407 [Dreissena polymorpha]|uniref:Transmembrane protein n=1 Tax=Dreissena polymorpha TaxID=45954 RepID=A0A9D4S0W4_DREPO|nr:hypothetical protein DPMN_012407 [Dreissena polymorpha]